MSETLHLRPAEPARDIDADLRRLEELDALGWDLGMPAVEAVAIGRDALRRLKACDLALKDALVRAAAAEAECGRWRAHKAAESRGHHDRMAGVPEGDCPYPAPADPEGETAERAWWGIGWRDTDAQLRLAGAEAEAERLGLELLGKQKAFDLLLAGMESQAEQMHELKQRVRELEAGRKGGAP